MTITPEKQVKLPNASELQCRLCGVVELIHMDWRRCYACTVACVTRNTRTYPSICPSCCRKTH